jgi:hypothetical protein
MGRGRYKIRRDFETAARADCRPTLKFTRGTSCTGQALPAASLSEKNKDIRSTKSASKIYRNRPPMLFR